METCAPWPGAISIVENRASGAQELLAECKRSAGKAVKNRRHRASRSRKKHIGRPDGPLAASAGGEGRHHRDRSVESLYGVHCWETGFACKS